MVEGDGYAVANLEALGDGPGFRKVRKELGVTAFGVNGIELPPHYDNDWEGSAVKNALGLERRLA